MTGPDRIELLGIPGYGRDEVGFFEETLVALRPDFIADWGTNRGSSARIFYELCKLHGIDAEIHTTELPTELEPLDRDHPGEGRAQFIRELSIIQHQGDGVTEGLIAWKIHGGKRALFFLDGDHLRESVFREIVWINRLVPHAWMLLHDTGNNAGPGLAALDFISRFPDSYTETTLHSQTGVMRLVPR